MSEPTIYDQGYVSIDGALLSNNQEFELTLDGDDQDVPTIPLGWNGQSQSPKKTVITLKNVVPPAGFDFDGFKATLNSTKHEVRVQRAANGQSYITKGFFRKPKIAGGVGKTLMYDLEFHGTPSQWQ